MNNRALRHKRHLRGRSVRVLVIAALSASLGAAAAPSRVAGEPAWSPHLFGPIARDAHAATFAVYDDGTGPALYAAGAFDRAGSLTGLGGVAKWNGASWETVGGGTNGVVLALCVFNGELVASGLFTNAGGIACNRIAKWNGATWAPLGSGLEGFATSLAEYQGQLYAAGGFLSAGGVSAVNISRWDGTNWSAVGTPPTGVQINALMVQGGKLWVGGLFTLGVSANVATWDGTLWAGVGTGTPAPVYALAEYGGQVIAGEAASAGGLGLQAWNGVSWVTLGGGVNGSIFELAGHNGQLYVLGDFTSAGATAISYLAQWDGGAWSAVGAAFPEPLSQIPTNDMISYGTDLIVGTAGAGAVDTPVYGGVGRWNGTAWSALGGGVGWRRQGQGVSGRISSLASYGGEIVAGGNLRRAGDVPVNRLATWNGNRWAPLGLGISGAGNTVEALLPFNGDLVVGGNFTTAGALGAPGIARWSGGSWLTLGSGMNAPVFDLCEFNGDLIAGGAFGTAGGVTARRVARWNGSTWSALGTGIDPTAGTFVNRLAIYQNELIAAGLFTTAGGGAAANIARWNGVSWAPLGSGVNGQVSALAVHEDKLIVGGRFTSAGSVTASGIALWDGAFWSAIGTGVENPGGEVLDLAVHDGDVWVAGIFTTISGVNSNSMARWDGSQWHAMPEQPGFNVYELATLSDAFSEQPALYVAGNFFGVDGTMSRGLARFGEGPTVSRLYVDSAAPAGGDGLTWNTAFASLQQALIAAEMSNGVVEELWVADGTYTPTGPNGDRALSFHLIDGVAIYGGFGGIGVNETSLSQRNPDVNITILSGDLNGNDGPDFVNYTENSYHVVVASNVSAGAVLDGVTVRSGNANHPSDQLMRFGGGLYASNGGPTFRDCRFILNRANEAGAMYFTGFCGFTLDEVVVADNLGVTSNAGILMNGNQGGPYADVLVENCTFARNTAPATAAGAGGGFNVNSANVRVRLCLFEENVAARGAGLGFGSDGSLSVLNCTFVRNISNGPATFCGGAALQLAGNIDNVIVQNCSFLGNRATNGIDGRGAGVRIHGNADAARIANCVFVGNTADVGGAVATANQSTSLRNCTLVHNVATIVTGGFYMNAEHGQGSLHNSIVWGNTDATGIGSATAQIAAIGPAATVTYSIVQGGWPGAGNRNINPLFRVNSSPGPDGDWDGVDDVYGDSRLLPVSPAIDAGNNSLVAQDLADLDNDGNTTEPTPTDLGGNGRFRDFWTVPDTGVGTAPMVDMGAYEHVGGQVLVSANPSLTVWDDSVETDSLQAALDFARSYPGEVSEIWVSAGEYRPDDWPGVITPGDRTASFELVPGVTIFGGFAGDETAIAERDPVTNVTVLSGDLNGNDGPGFAGYGDNSLHVVKATTPHEDYYYLDSLTIRGGNADGPDLSGDDVGGGVYSSATSVYLVEVRLKENRARRGGGLFANGLCTPVSLGCTMADNTATDDGGALYFSGSTCTPQITSTDFSGNSALDGGGAIAAFSASLRMSTNCTLMENSAGRGGAMFFSGPTTSIIDTALFERNTTFATGGGAIACVNSSPQWFNCRMYANVAGGGGTGGAVFSNLGAPLFANCIMVGNRSAGGGACSFNNGAPMLVNCTIVQNTSTSQGGALRLENADAGVSNCILDANTPIGSVIQLLGTSAPVIKYAIVQGGWPAGVGIIDADPVFMRKPSPGTDGEWDGVDDDFGDLRYYYGSPAIDAGNIAGLPPDLADLDGDDITAEPLSRDINGHVRQDDDGYSPNVGIGAPAIDIGATEFDPPVATTEVVYVNPTPPPTGQNNGTTWSNGYTNLIDALVAAANSGGITQEIWVKGGTYKPARPGDAPSATFRLPADINLYGHFSGAEVNRGQRNIANAAHTTVLSGDLAGDDVSGDFPNGTSRQDNSFHVVTAENLAVETVLDGFTISGGNANGPIQSAICVGAGAYVIASDLVIENCTFRDNYSSHGGAVHVNNIFNLVIRPTIQSTDFENNLGGLGGSALQVANGGITTIFNCTFRRNKALGGGGGAVAIGLSDPRIISCRFLGNVASTDGGAVSLNPGSPRISNCVFAGNAAVDGGAIRAYYTADQSSNVAVANCTFSGNVASGSGGALFEDAEFGPSVFTVVNSALWGNEDAGGLDASAQIHVASGGTTVTHSLVQGGWPDANDTNLNADPDFDDPPHDGPDNQWGTADDHYGDLRLSAGSPAIDRGRNALIARDDADLDCDGNTVEPCPFDFNGAPRRADDEATDDCDGLPAGNCGVPPIVDLGAFEAGPIVGDKIFVNAAAPGPVHDGTSWATAFRHVQDALNYTGTLGCGAVEIWVARGTYMTDGGRKPFIGQYVPGTGDRTSTFQLQMSVVLIGGLVGVENPGNYDLDLRNFGENPTILSGDLLFDDPGGTVDNAYHVVTGTGTTDIAILDGFTISGGVAADPPTGGGFITLADGPWLRNCIVEGNTGECAGGFDSIGGRVTVEGLISQLNQSTSGHGVGLTMSTISLLDDWSLLDGRIESFGTTFSGAGTLQIGPDSLLKVRAVPPCDADVIVSLRGALGIEGQPFDIFVPETAGDTPEPAQWKIDGVALRDVVLLGSNTTVYIAPSLQGGPPATLTWSGSYLEYDVSANGQAEAGFHWGGTLTITGELYDGPGPGAALLNPSQSQLLTASVGSFSVRETAAQSNQLEFVEKPTFAPNGGFLVANAAGFTLAGEQELTLDFAPAVQNNGELTDFDTSTTIALTAPATFSHEPVDAPRGVTTTYSDIRGTGDIVIDAGASLVVAGSAVLNLSGEPDDVCNPGDPAGTTEVGLLTVNGLLHVQDAGRVHNTTITVTLADLLDATQIVHNDIRLAESAPGFGGEFFVSGGATVSCNVITSDGDRYLDLDPDPTADPRPSIVNNRIYVLIKQQPASEQGELLELRTQDFDNAVGDGASGAYPLAGSAGYDDPWVLERLEVLPNAKVNLTNRSGFVFQDPAIATPEAMYVREVRLHPGAVLNTGLQRLYYQSLVDENGAALGPPDADGFLSNGARLLDHPLLGFSLKVIAMEDDTEFDVRVRRRLRDPADDAIQPAQPPFVEGEIARVPFPIAENPANHAMRMSTRRTDCPPGQPPCPPATSVAAHGAFARAGEDRITVAFRYKFCGGADDELLVYLSDSPDVSENLGEPIARIRPPADGPGSVDSDRFAEFSGRFARGDLNFRRGTYVELELRGEDACVIIDDWDPLCCGGQCGEYSGDLVVTNIDLLYVLASTGNSVGSTNNCIDDPSRDHYIDLIDVMLSDTMNYDAYAIGNGLCITGGTTGFNAPASPVALPIDRLIVAGKPDVGGSLGQADGLYPVDAATATSDAALPPPGAAVYSAAGPRGHGRLVLAPGGQMHQIHAAQGIIRLSDGKFVVQPGDVAVGGHTVRVGMSPFGPGLPILDAAFDPDDATRLFVVPVRVIPPDGAQYTYSAVAQLDLAENAQTGETTWSIASMQRVYGLDPRSDSTVTAVPPTASPVCVQFPREIELDATGRLFVASALGGGNQNDWLLIYDVAAGNASEQRVRLTDLPVPLTAPVAMRLTADGARLYIASAKIEDGGESTRIHELAVAGNPGAVTVTQSQVLTVHNMRVATALAEHPGDGSLYALGYRAGTINVTTVEFTEFDPLFTSPTLAALPVSGAVTAIDIAGADLALPVSAVFAVSPCQPGDMNADGAVSMADVPHFVDALLNGPADADAICRADANDDDAVNGGDVQAFVDRLIGP